MAIAHSDCLTASRQTCNIHISGDSMKLSNVLLNLSLVLLFPLLLTGCASVNHKAVKADATLPESTTVEVATVEYDDSYPEFLVSVSPVTFSTPPADIVVTVEDNSEPEIDSESDSAIITSEDETVVIENSAAGKEEVLAQLITALSNSGNISLVDYSTIKWRKDGTTRMALAENERGPYLVRATVTEYGERVEENTEGIDSEFGWLGALLSAGGAASGKDGLFWAGLGIALANPTIVDLKNVKIGAVTLDVALIEGRTGRVVESFPVSGTFKSMVLRQGGGISILNEEHVESAKSAVGQAVRVASNEAMLRITEILKQKGRPKRLHDPVRNKK